MFSASFKAGGKHVDYRRAIHFIDPCIVTMADVGTHDT